MFRILFSIFILTSLTAPGQEYQLLRPPSKFVDYQAQSISIITQAEMELGELPHHPKITWLGYSSVRLQTIRDPDTGDPMMQTDNRITFIANSPGLIEFPPIPIILENKEFFIRLGEIRVTKNPASKTDTRLEIFWNDQPTPPKQVHLGEAVEIKFIEMVRETDGNYSNRPYFTPPSTRILGGQWHQYTRDRGRKPYPSDYFRSTQELLSRDNRLPFAFRNYRDPNDPRDIYRESNLEFEGRDYFIRSYKARLYFTKTGTARGSLAGTLGTSRARSHVRTHVLPFEIDVIPVPPLPNDQAIDTGLIGDWEFETSIRPRTPKPATPLRIDISIEGQGNPSLLNSFDFSGEGFPSVETELQSPSGDNYDFWEANFRQTLLPTGKIGTLPAITLASFDTVADQWRYHQITPAITLPGFTDLTSSLTPRTSPGPAITRPVLLNLPAATFGIFALAPLLPFLFGFAKKRLDERDPEAKKRERLFQKLIKDFQSGKGTPEAIDDQLLPLLRTRLDLPAGATVSEVADALDHPDLAATLRTHAESSFSAAAKPIDFKALATQLTKLSLLLILTLPVLRAATLEEANAFFEKANYREASESYQELIKVDPNRASLHFNLAQAQLSAGNPARARAACHTALLLKPLDQDARNLMSEIRESQGDLTVARNRFLDLRPDQWILIAALTWLIAFLYFALRKLRPLPRSPGFILIILSLVLLGTAAWRQNHAYIADQYMILADELPREVEAGTPDWDFPPFRAGQIVKVTEVNATHARITSSDSNFWLPINELQQVW